MRILSLLVGFAVSVHAAELGSVTGTAHLAGTNQPVASAIVYLGAKNGQPTATNIVLDVRNGVLQPHVQVAMRGATLVLHNSDPSLHVVRLDMLNSTNGPVRVLTQAMPYAGFQKAFALDGFRETTLLRITGGNGEEMTAYIAVLPHPWGTLSDAEGRFVLTGIPAGSYKLYVWHEILGTLTRDIRVATGHPATVDFEFSSAARKRVD